MKNHAVLLLLACALSAVLLSLFGGESYPHMRTMQQSVELQREHNSELDHNVRQLRSNVKGLRTDDRELEKAARNELGMARPDEMIFVFEKKDQQDEAKEKQP